MKNLQIPQSVFVVVESILFEPFNSRVEHSAANGSLMEWTEEGKRREKPEVSSCV